MSTETQIIIVWALIIVALAIAVRSAQQILAKHLDDRLGRLVGDLPTPKPLPTLSADVIKSMHIIRAGHVARQCKACREGGCRCQRTCTTCGVQA